MPNNWNIEANAARTSIALWIRSGSGWDGVNFLHSYPCGALLWHLHQCVSCAYSIKASLLSTRQVGCEWAGGWEGMQTGHQWTKGYSLHLHCGQHVKVQGKVGRKGVFRHHSIYLLKQLLLVLRPYFPGRKWMGSNELAPLSLWLHSQLLLSVLIYHYLNLQSSLPSFFSYYTEERNEQEAGWVLLCWPGLALHRFPWDGCDPSGIFCQARQMHLFSTTN